MKNTIQFWALIILAELMNMQGDTLWQVIFVVAAGLNLIAIVFFDKEAQ